MPPKVKVTRDDIINVTIELVGKSGNHPTISGNGFLLICSVYDTLISPDVLWSTEFTFDIEK